ncbi:hypothetical protein GGF46_001584 [Coemansia sp. RSA 552]|nr:hypothetical protein GGF46_001584 [Coemansia sp. RSA 552]
MFASPSVKVRRRQPAANAKLGAASSESTSRPRQTLKRRISIAADSGPPTANVDSLQGRYSSCKKAAPEVKPTGWLASFAQQSGDGEAGQHLDQPSSRLTLAAEGEGPRGDTDSDGRRVLLRGDKHAVFDVAGFPDAVQRQLGSIDFRSVPVTAGLNSASKFAFVATPTACFVWAYASGAATTVHRLPMPDPEDTAAFEAPVVALVPVGGVQSDVGVLVCSTAGQIRYWDRVAFGLGGTERFHSRGLELSDPADRCCQIVEVHTDLFVIATVKGYLFQISLQGATGLETRLLSRNAGARAGMLGRMTSLLGGAANAPVAADARDSLVAMAPGGRTEIRHSRELYVLTRERLVKWVVSRSHPERLMYSMDILQALGPAAAHRYDADVQVSVHDVAVARDGAICVLARLQAPRLAGQVQLALFIMRSDRVSVEPAVVGLWPLDYAPDTPPSQSGPERPRLVLPEGGPGLYVVMRTAIVASLIPPDTATFEEAVSFREGGFLLGSSADSRPLRSTEKPGSSTLDLLCLGTGVLQVCIDTAKAAGATCPANNTLPDVEGGGADGDAAGTAAWPGAARRASKPPSTGTRERELQDQIEQAVFFGVGNAHNPLEFTIRSQATGTDAALETAALRVSQSILDNTSRFIVDRLDLGAHLKERLCRARAVMQFISQSGLGAKLPRAARVHLCAHAEKLAAAVALWDYQNDVWAAKSNAASQLLANVVASFLESVGLKTKDSLRIFFRQHVAAIGDLLVFMRRNLVALRRALEDSESGRRDSQLVSYEANRITIAILQSAFVYRYQNAALYDIDFARSSPPTGPARDVAESWTEHPAIADLLVQRLESSYRLCRDVSGRHCAPIYDRISQTTLPNDSDPNDTSRSLSIFDDAVSVSHASLPDAAADEGISKESRLGLDADNPYTSPLALLRETIDQIGPLANLCFRVHVDRISYLQAVSPNDVLELALRYDATRPRYLMCLVPLGRAPVAFRLAEEYHDLKTLVALVFATDPKNAAAHLRKYVQLFGKGLADMLFAFYERRQAWASLLYTQDPEFDQWLKEYIDKRAAENVNSAIVQIGWIHDVKMSDFSAAAPRLARAGRCAREVSQAQTMLSLSKLAFVAGECQEGTHDEAAVEAHARLEDALEMCQVQDSLSLYFTTLVRAHRGHSTELTWRRCDDVSDKKAVLDAAMLTTSPELRHGRPALYIVYNELIRRIWNGRSLAAEDLLDALTFPDGSSTVDAASASCTTEDAEQCNALVRERCSLAVDILSRASFNLPEQTREAALRTIWRRVFLSDDWPEIARRLGGNVPDSDLRAELARTRLHAVLESCLVERELAHPDWYLLPADSFGAGDLEYLVATRLEPWLADRSKAAGEWSPLSPTTGPAIEKDYVEEDARLRTAIECGLDSYYTEILRIVSDQMSQNQSQLAAGEQRVHGHEGVASSPVSTKALDGDEDTYMNTD